MVLLKVVLEVATREIAKERSAMKVWVIAPSAAGREVSDTPRQFRAKDGGAGYRDSWGLASPIIGA